MKKFFYHHYFFVQPQVFFPRFESEELIALILNYAPSLLPADSKVLEVGVGTGVLSASLALAKPNWIFAGVDINPLALTLTHKNFAYHQLTGHFWESNLFEKVAAHQKYHLIVANLPYVDQTRTNWDPKILQWDPPNALFAKKKGLFLLKKFLQTVASHLAFPYLIALEIGIDQETHLQKWVPLYLPTSYFFFKKDFNKITRFLFIYSPPALALPL